MADSVRSASASQFALSPYPGLRAFRQDEAEIFFGRDEQIDRLLDRLEHERLVAVAGESGCGKSSLVRAGLLPALEAGLLHGGGPRWRIVDLRPGNRPIYHLAQKLARVLSSDPERDAPLLAARLRYGPRSVADILRDFRLPEGTEILIMVDQFEELIRFRARIDPDEADAFVALLLETVADRTLRVRVVLTLRTDYLGGCANFAGLPEALNGSQYLVPRLTREQLHEAIVRPAQVFEGEVDSTLTNQLINEIGQSQDQLPVLEHALLAMWRQARDQAARSATAAPPASGSIKLTIDDYVALGGIGEALSRHADEVYRALGGAEQQRIAVRLFCALWDGNASGNDTRRPCTVREAAEIAGVTTEAMTAVANAFRRSEHSLLMPPPDVALTEDTVLDIGHESLFRHWKQLAEWIAKEADDAKQYRLWLNHANARDHRNGDLLSDKAMERALAWQSALQPTAAWARRYSEQPDDFANLQRFLRDSLRGQRIRQWTNRSAIALVSGLICVGMFLLARLGEQRDQERERTELQRQQIYSAATFGARLEPVRALQLALEAQGDGATSQPGTALHGALRGSHFRSMVFPSLGSFEDARFLNDRQIITVGPGDGLAVWDVASGSRVYALYGAIPHRLAVHIGQHATLAATASDDGTVDLWDLSTRTRRWTGRRQVMAISDIAFSPDGRWLATASDDGSAVLWDAASGEPSASLIDHIGGVVALAFSHDSQRLATLGTDDRIVLWDTRRGKKLELFARLPGASRIAFDATGRYLAAAGSQGVTLWDAITHHEESSLLRGHSITAVAFSPDGRRIATTGLDGTLRVLDAGSRTQRFSTSADVPLPDDGRATALAASHDDEASWLQSVAVSGDGSKLVTTGRDGSAKIWDVEAGGEILTFRAHEGAIRRIAYHPAGDRFATAGDDGTVSLWSIEGRLVAQLADGDAVRAMDFNHLGTKLAISRGHRVMLWELTQRAASEPALELPDDVQDLQMFHTRDRLVAAAGRGLAVWATIGTRADFTIDAGTPVHAVAVSPEDDIIASECRTAPGPGSEERPICLWNASHGERIAILGAPTAGEHRRAADRGSAHRKPILALRFSADGRWLVSSSEDKTIKIWNVADRSHAATLRGHRESITGLALAPDGKLLTSSGNDLVRLWNTTSHLPQEGFPDAEFGSGSVAFAPDGTSFVAGGHDGVVRIYAVESDALRPIARDRTPIHLTEGECVRYANQGCREPRTALQLANEARHLLQHGLSFHGDCGLAAAAYRDQKLFGRELARFTAAQVIHHAIGGITTRLATAAADFTNQADVRKEGSEHLASELATAQRLATRRGEQALRHAQRVDPDLVLAPDPAALAARIVAWQLSGQAQHFAAQAGRRSWAEQAFRLTPPAEDGERWQDHAATTVANLVTITRVQDHVASGERDAALHLLSDLIGELNREDRMHQLVLLRLIAAVCEATDMHDIVALLIERLYRELDDVEVLTDFAAYLIRTGQRGKAKIVLGRALDLDPTNDRALEYFGEVQRDSGQPAGALNALRAISPMAPNYHKAASTAGDIAYEQLEMLREGYRWMSFAVDPADTDSWAHLAETAWGNNRFTEARLIASRVLEAHAIKRSTPDVELAMRFVLVAALYQGQDVAAAEPALDALVALAPQVTANHWGYRGSRAAVLRIREPRTKRFLAALLTYCESSGRTGTADELRALLREARTAQGAAR